MLHTTYTATVGIHKNKCSWQVIRNFEWIPATSDRLQWRSSKQSHWSTLSQNIVQHQHTDMSPTHGNFTHIQHKQFNVIPHSQYTLISYTSQCDTHHNVIHNTMRYHAYLRSQQAQLVQQRDLQQQLNLWQRVLQQQQQLPCQ